MFSSVYITGDNGSSRQLEAGASDFRNFWMGGKTDNKPASSRSENVQEADSQESWNGDCGKKRNKKEQRFRCSL